jgi:hypothetical protein
MDKEAFFEIAGTTRESDNGFGVPFQSHLNLSLLSEPHISQGL